MPRSIGMTGVGATEAQHTDASLQTVMVDRQITRVAAAYTAAAGSSTHASKTVQEAAAEAVTAEAVTAVR